MKSGTTSVQSLLFAEREALAAQGVLPLGARWGEQVDAVRGLLARPADPGPGWQRLVAQAREWDGTSVISMEFLGTGTPDQVHAAVGSFGDLPVHVVVTARDLNRTLPSLWQEAVQNGRSWAWPDYLEAARRARPRQAIPPRRVSDAGRSFWRQQDACHIVGRWTGAVGPGRVSLVTLPPPGAPRSRLAERFGLAVGFALDPLAVGVTKNAALGAASAELLRQVNARLRELGLSDADAQRLRKRVLAKQVLAARREQEPPIGLEVPPWVRHTSARTVQLLQASGVRLVGEWSDLEPVPVLGVDPSGTGEADLVAAARDGFRGLRTAMRRRLGHGSLPRWPDPVDAAGAVEALARLVCLAASRDAAA